jgi:putative ABC transport system permease protein
MSLYRILLRLYPASFRAEYGAELLRTFEEARQDRGALASGLAAIADVVPNALAAHLGILRQDLRFALRGMNRSRGFALTVVLITALGVGANTATFSVADLVLLRPLPFPESDRLVRLCEGPREGGGWGCMNELSAANYRDVTASHTAVESWGTFSGRAVNLVGAGPPVRIAGERLSAQVLPILGVAPLLGRGFDTTGARDRDARSVILSYGLWQSQFGGDRAVLGGTIRLDDTPHLVIGIMPPEFHFPTPDTRLWTLLTLTEQDFLSRENTWLQAIGRLRPGATFERARSDLQLVFDRLARDYPETNAETGFSFFRQRDQMSPRYRIMLLALCGASLSLLLLTGANLANLLLVRAAGRERELAVRAALGAGRERLVRQMLTESVLLALIGGAAGVLVAGLTFPLLIHLIPTSLPLAAVPRPDARVLLLAGGFTLLTGIGFGLVPALKAGGRTGLDALRESGRGGGGRRQRLRTALVTVEVAVSVVLLVSSGLLIRAVWNVQAVDPGFATESVLTLRTALPSTRIFDGTRRNEFYQRVLAEVRSLPGVESAGYTSGIPMVLTGGIAGVEVPGREVENRRRAGVGFRFVTPGLLPAFGVPLLDGRGIEESDVATSARVAVVSQSFVERYWPGQPALGKTFTVRDEDRIVVGIARDIRVRGLERSSEPQLYIPAAQAPDTIGELYVPKDLVIRAGAAAGGLVSAVRDIIARVDPEQPVSDVRLMSQVVQDQTADRRAQLRVLGALAAVALLLTGIGIHGLLAYMVAQRSREIGVRLALGAAPRRVGRMIVGEAARLALVGGLPGLLVSYWAARSMRALLFGIGPSDPATLGGGVIVVMLVTFAGALIPAFRAVRVSPVEAMRGE